MNMKEGWVNSTLEVLLGKSVVLMKSDENSYLIVTCNNLHKKTLSEFCIEDLRIMIGQSIGLKFLLPLAIAELTKNILSEGHFYEGDLLKSVLTSDKNYWLSERAHWEIVCDLFNKNESKLASFHTTKEIRKGLFEAFLDFKKICL